MALGKSSPKPPLGCPSQARGARPPRARSPTWNSTSTECSTAPFASKVTLSARESSRLAASPWSGSAANSQECIGPSPAWIMFWTCAVCWPVARWGASSGKTAKNKNAPLWLPLPDLNNFVAHPRQTYGLRDERYFVLKLYSLHHSRQALLG